MDSIKNISYAMKGQCFRQYVLDGLKKLSSYLQHVCAASGICALLGCGETVCDESRDMLSCYHASTEDRRWLC